MVSHGDDASMAELQSRVELIHKGSPINRGPASASASRIASLHHEGPNDTVEESAVVVAFKAKLEEIATGTGCFGAPKLDFNVTVVGFEDHLA